ncbi:MAG: peptidoglycan-binding protein [Xanthobacteraceae bacterium]|nr:peptidoglycan-binding protein [Xanthobacteraceae bacterium]
MPRRRRTGKAATRARPKARAEAERGFVMRMLLRSPKDSAAGFLALAAVIAILVNALFLQAGHHPSPMFGEADAITAPVAMTASISALPRPRPSEADAGHADEANDDTGAIAAHARQASNAAHASTRKQPARQAAQNDPLGELISSQHKIVAVQRALTRYGYGQFKPTGTVGPETRAAIQKFERERKLPVTGKISNRLVVELSAMTGQAIY